MGLVNCNLSGVERAETRREKRRVGSGKMKAARIQSRNKELG